VTDRPYRPSNGTEGMDFMDHFCDRCERDRIYRETQDGTDGCPIAAASFLYDIKEPGYPPEWVEDAEGFARCTAFEDEEKVTEETREYRRALAAGQKDLFEEKG
jgi:hypothetical protein